MRTNTFLIVNDDGEEEALTIPVGWDICHRCHGDGSHVNPAIDGNGISGDDECWQDDQFTEMYFSGGYDVTCTECNGSGKVLVPDAFLCPKDDLNRYWAYINDKADYEAECRHQREMGY